MDGVPREYRDAGGFLPALPVTLFLNGGPSRRRPEFVYPMVRTQGPFDRVILSPNGSVGQKGTVDFAVGPSSTEVFRLVSWAGPEAVQSDRPPLPPPVKVDVLELARPACELWASARLRGAEEDTAIRRLGVTLFDASRANENPLGEPAIESRSLVSVSLPVEFVSQFTAGGADSGSRCCPTSAVMVLRFWGIDVKVEEFARRSYDHRHGIQGNWSLTVAAISSFGMKSWIQKHTSLGELHAPLQSGRPVIVSISYGAGELPGAPIMKSNGHLLVVCGFTERGDVRVCDPAGRTSAEGPVAYDRSAFARAWLGHGGIAIHAVPEEWGR